MLRLCISTLERTWLHASPIKAHPVVPMPTHCRTPILVTVAYTTLAQLLARGLVAFRANCTVRAEGAMCPLGGLGYYEVEILHAGMGTRFGFCVAEEQSSAEENGPCCKGVGDDGSSWGVDGSSSLKWHDGESSPFSGLWREGDVVGLACDLQEGRGRLLVSLNGDFALPHGTAFDLPTGRLEGGLCPALSAGFGLIRCNFGYDRPFRHAPPSPEYRAMAIAGATA